MNREREIINRTYAYRLELIKIFSEFFEKNVSNKEICSVLYDIMDEVFKSGDRIFDDSFWRV